MRNGRFASQDRHWCLSCEAWPYGKEDFSSIWHTHTHTHTHAQTHTDRQTDRHTHIEEKMNATITPVCALPLMSRLALGSLPLSPFSLLSLSPSQVNCRHVIKRPSLYPLTLVNEKMGNKKQFCAANMEKIDNRERCVRLSPLMSRAKTPVVHT